MEIIRKTSTSHRFADVKRGTTPGHGIDHEGPGRGVIVQDMCDDRRRDRARMRDAKGPIVPERPDVVGRRAKPRGEAVASPQVFVSRMDRLGPGVEREQAAPGTGVAGPRDSPDGPGLAVEILAPQTNRARDRGVRTTRQLFPTVGIPTLGLLDCARGWVAELAEVGEPAPPRLGQKQCLERIGLAHHLTERLAALTVIFEDRASPRCSRAEGTDLAGNFGQSQGTGAGEPAVARNEFVDLGVGLGHDDQRDKHPMFPDAVDEVVDLGGRIAVNGDAETVRTNLVNGERMDGGGGGQV